MPATKYYLTEPTIAGRSSESICCACAGPGKAVRHHSSDGHWRSPRQTGNAGKAAAEQALLPLAPLCPGIILLVTWTSAVPTAVLHFLL